MCRENFAPTGIRSPDLDGPGIESLYRLSYPDPQEEGTYSNVACLKMRYRHKAQSENPNRQEHPERKGIRRKRTENVFKQREYKGVDCIHLAQDEQSVLLTW